MPDNRDLPGPVDRPSREVFLAILQDVAEGGPPPVEKGPDHDEVTQALEVFRENGGVILTLGDGPNEIQE